MSKHTQGPWYFDGANIQGKYCGHMNGICKMLFTGDFEVDEQVKADAKLIAAAPDLLAALKEISFSGRIRNRDKAFQERIETIIAEAIAKAEN